MPDGERRRIETLVEANLGDGTVELTVETRDGLVYRISRRLGDDPVVVTEEGAATEICLRAPGSAFRADIYSQNQIEQIADQALSQLSLIDNFEPARIAQITGEIRTLTSRLGTNATSSARHPLRHSGSSPVRSRSSPPGASIAAHRR